MNNSPLPEFARVRWRVERAMTTHPHQAASDEADPEKQSTPAGFVKDLEKEADEIGASTDPTHQEPSPPDNPPSP